MAAQQTDREVWLQSEAPSAGSSRVSCEADEPSRWHACSRLPMPAGPHDGHRAAKAADPQAETVEKYGLEAGLWKVFTSKGEAAEGGQGKGAQAKQLLAKYGSAYLITSISFAAVSFAACYALVNAGAPSHSIDILNAVCYV